MSSEKDSVFISSVQKELEPERLALFSLLTTDPFLKEHVKELIFRQTIDKSNYSIDMAPTKGKTRLLAK